MYAIGRDPNGTTITPRNFPVLFGGSDYGTNPTIYRIKTDSSGNQYIVGGTANNASQAFNPLYMSGTAVSAEPTLATNGQNSGLVTDLAHKLIVIPYANKENFVKGSASATGTSDTSVVASAGAGLKNYITSISIANTGANTSLILIKDGSGGATLWQTIAPAGGGSNIHFPVPIAGSAATAVFFNSGTASTTVYCSIAGYKGS